MIGQEKEINEITTSWEKSATVIPSKTKRRTRATAPVNYPIFRESINHTTDPEWIAILTKAEKGLFPPGFSYNKETIYYRNKNGEEDIRLISSIDPEMFFEELRCFMNFHGVITKSDKLNPSEKQEELDFSNWHSLPGDYRKAIHARFIEHEKEKNRLSSSEVFDLISVIQVGFFIGAFDKKLVHMENGSITSIDGLIYNKETKKYSIDPMKVVIMKPSSKTKTTSKPRKTFNDYWDQYLQGDDPLPETKNKNKRGRNVNISSEPESDDYSSII